MRPFEGGPNDLGESSSASGYRRKGVDVLYIGGWGRSGSTLLDRMLGRVPGWMAVGEVREIWLNGLAEDRPCSCGETFRECPFWREVGEVAYGGWDKLDVEEVLSLRYRVDRPWNMAGLAGAPYFGSRPSLRRYMGLLESLYPAMMDVASASTIVDSSKLPSHALIVRRLPRMKMRVVHLVRDSRAVGHSWRRSVVKWPEADGAGAELLHRYGVLGSCVRWNVYNALIEPFASLGVPYTRIRYDDLISDPAGSISTILEMWSSRDSATASAFSDGSGIDLPAGHMIAGNPSRFVNGPTAIRIDDSWTREMPTLDKVLTTALTFPLLMHYRFAVLKRRHTTEAPTDPVIAENVAPNGGRAP